MSSEYIKHNGQKVKKSSVMSRNKRYRYNKSGSLVEITNEADLTADDFVISGSKSTLRRISDIEQNVAMIYTRLTTSDGASETASSESSDDVSVGSSGKTTRFKGNVVFEKGIYISNSKGSNVNVSTSFADKVINKSNAYTNVSVSNDTLTFTTGEGNTKQVSISDANTSYDLAAREITGGAAVRLSGSDSTNDDVEFKGSGATTVTRSGNTITITSTDTNTDTNTWRPVVNNLTSTDTSSSLSAAQGKALKDLVDGKATPSDITTAINNLVDGAPAALNTLNELAAAIGDNASYAASITTALSGKASTGTVMSAGNGLTGGGSLGSNRTFHVGGGNGITVSADGVAMSGSYTGTFTASGDVCAYSDASLKTNIETIDGALDKVESVRGVTFERIADGSVSAGVVAQELETVLPEAVHTDEHGVKMVAYGNITGLLIEAVKELSAEVKALKGE